MSKINPFNLQRPEPKTETRTFIDPLHPDVELTLTLRTIDETEKHRALDAGQQFLEIYVGHPETGEGPKQPLPMVGGRPVVISKSLAFTVASLMEMQVGDSLDELYTFEQWVAIAATLPTAFRQIVRWSAEFDRLEAASKNH